MLPDVAGHPETQLICGPDTTAATSRSTVCTEITGNQLIVRPKQVTSAAHRDRQPGKNTALYEPTPPGMMRSGVQVAEHHLIRELRRYGRAVNRPQQYRRTWQKTPDT